MVKIYHMKPTYKSCYAGVTVEPSGSMPQLFLTNPVLVLLQSIKDQVYFFSIWCPTTYPHCVIVFTKYQLFYSAYFSFSSLASLSNSSCLAACTRRTQSRSLSASAASCWAEVCCDISIFTCKSGNRSRIVWSWSQKECFVLYCCCLMDHWVLI